MRDLRFLNDLFKHENEAVVQPKLDGWNLCGTPIVCIHKGETPSKNVDQVVIHNFLKDTVIGFVVTEKVVVVNPVIPVCPGCETMKDECPGLCDDPPEFEVPVTDDEQMVDEDVGTCNNCLYLDTPLNQQPCDGCFDQNQWQFQARDENPTPVADAYAETLFKMGCWTSLENRLHDLMSEWASLADDCKFQSTTGMCKRDSNQFGDCAWDKCPRVKS